MSRMRRKSSEAREHLLKALAALEDPKAFCKQHGNGRYAEDPDTARAYTIGAVKSMIEFALQALGEPIDPFRPTELRQSAPPPKEVLGAYLPVFGTVCTCDERLSGSHADWCPKAPTRLTD
jgi:hypothetical protein